MSKVVHEGPPSKITIHARKLLSSMIMEKNHIGRVLTHVFIVAMDTIDPAFQCRNRPSRRVSRSGFKVIVKVLLYLLQMSYHYAPIYSELSKGKRALYGQEVRK